MGYLSGRMGINTVGNIFKIKNKVKVSCNIVMVVIIKAIEKMEIFTDMENYLINKLMKFKKGLL